MKKLLLGLISVYRRRISPHTSPHCRFIPTCSEYAFDAITKYGAGKGFLLAAKRLLKCHPFHWGEHDFYDPVP